MHRLLLLLLAAGSFLSGCGEGPSDTLGVAEFELVSIAGQPLPAPSVLALDGRPLVVMVSSRIRFLPNNRGVEQARQQYPVAGQPTEEQDVDLPFRYTLSGTVIRIHYDCNDTGSCIAGPHLVGTLEAGRLVFDQALGRVPLEYRRK